MENFILVSTKKKKMLDLYLFRCKVNVLTTISWLQLPCKCAMNIAVILYRSLRTIASGHCSILMVNCWMRRISKMETGIILSWSQIMQRGAKLSRYLGKLMLAGGRCQWPFESTEKLQTRMESFVGRICTEKY